MQQAGIEVRNVSKVYASRDRKVVALRDLSFTVKPGEFVALVGPSGCGKTTVLKAIGGLASVTTGEISVLGHTTEEARIKGMFSFVFQNPVLMPWRRVVDNVRLPGELLRRETREPAALLERVGLSGFESKYPHELSGGMAQRVALARALTFDPSVILLDEPFGALDEFTRDDLNTLLAAICAESGVTAILVTHNLAEAVFLSQRVLVMSARPGTIISAVEVPFAEPRDANVRDTPEFFELVRRLRRCLA